MSKQRNNPKRHSRNDSIDWSLAMLAKENPLEPDNENLTDNKYPRNMNQDRYWPNQKPNENLGNSSTGGLTILPHIQQTFPIIDIPSQSQLDKKSLRAPQNQGVTKTSQTSISTSQAAKIANRRSKVMSRIMVMTEIPEEPSISSGNSTENKQDSWKDNPISLTDSRVSKIPAANSPQNSFLPHPQSSSLFAVSPEPTVKEFSIHSNTTPRSFESGTLANAYTQYLGSKANHLSNPSTFNSSYVFPRPTQNVGFKQIDIPYLSQDFDTDSITPNPSFPQVNVRASMPAEPKVPPKMEGNTTMTNHRKTRSVLTPGEQALKRISIAQSLIEKQNQPLPSLPDENKKAKRESKRRSRQGGELSSHLDMELPEKPTKKVRDDGAVRTKSWIENNNFGIQPERNVEIQPKKHKKIHISYDSNYNIKPSNVRINADKESFIPKNDDSKSKQNKRRSGMYGLDYNTHITNFDAKQLNDAKQINRMSWNQFNLGHSKPALAYGLPTKPEEKVAKPTKPGEISKQWSSSNRYSAYSVYSAKSSKKESTPLEEFSFPNHDRTKDSEVKTNKSYSVHPSNLREKRNSVRFDIAPKTIAQPRPFSCYGSLSSNPTTDETGVCYSNYFINDQKPETLDEEAGPKNSKRTSQLLNSSSSKFDLSNTAQILYKEKMNSSSKLFFNRYSKTCSFPY